MPWVSSHRRRGSLFSRSSWVRSHYRRSPGRAGVPVVPLVIAAIVVIVLIAVF